MKSILVTILLAAVIAFADTASATTSSIQAAPAIMLQTEQARTNSWQPAVATSQPVIRAGEADDANGSFHLQALASAASDRPARAHHGPGFSAAGHRDDFSAGTVPGPGIMMLLGACFLGLAVCSKRRKQA